MKTLWACIWCSWQKYLGCNHPWYSFNISDGTCCTALCFCFEVQAKSCTCLHKIQGKGEVTKIFQIKYTNNSMLLQPNSPQKLDSICCHNKVLEHEIVICTISVLGIFYWLHNASHHIHSKIYHSNMADTPPLHKGFCNSNKVSSVANALSSLILYFIDLLKYTDPQTQFIPIQDRVKG